jgi:hypothetical protein
MLVKNISRNHQSDEQNSQCNGYGFNVHFLLSVLSLHCRDGVAAIVFGLGAGGDFQHKF